MGLFNQAAFSKLHQQQQRRRRRRQRWRRRQRRWRQRRLWQWRQQRLRWKTNCRIVGILLMQRGSVPKILIVRKILKAIGCTIQLKTTNYCRDRQKQGPEQWFNSMFTEWDAILASISFLIWLFYLSRVHWHWTNVRTAGSLKKYLDSVLFQVVRFEPGTAGYEAWMLPLSNDVLPPLF